MTVNFARAAANPHIQWSTIDTTLWSWAFAGKATTALCTHYFNLSYASNKYEWAPDPAPSTSYCHPSGVKYRPIFKVRNTNTQSIVRAGTAVLIPK